MLLPPPGILRPNRAAIEGGLSFAQAFQNGPALPWLARGGLAASTLALTGGGTIGALHGGHGLTTSGGVWGAISADNTYSLGTTSGTIIVGFVADHDSGSAGNRIMLIWGNTAFPAAYGVAISNFFGDWIAGWGDGADKRVSVSATGLYTSGEVLTTGLTWDATAQRVYMRGVQIASGAAATYGSTAGSDFRLGLYSAYPWISSTTGGILYALAFDRALSAEEMLAAERDMWWWAQQEPVRVARRGAGGTTFNDTITDALTAAESLVAAVSFSAELADSWVLAESLAAAVTFQAPLTDATSTSDSLVCVVTFEAPLSDSITAAEEFAAALNIPTEFSDALTAADSLAYTLVFGAALTDSVSASESFGVVATFAASTSETVTIAESFIGGLVFTSTTTDGWTTGDSLDDSLTLFAQAAFTMLQVTVVVGRIELVSGGPDATFTNLTEQQSRV